MTTRRIVTVYVQPPLVQRLRPGGDGRTHGWLLCVYDNTRLASQGVPIENAPRLGVFSSRRSSSSSSTAGIYYYPSDQRSFLRTCSPTPGCSRSPPPSGGAAYNHSKTTIRPQRMHDSDARQKAETKRKEGESRGSRHATGGDRIAVYMQSARKIGGK